MAAELCLSCYRRFNSRTPGGVRPLSEEELEEVQTFQFTHPGRGATEACVLKAIDDDVSIHAPREGCDTLLLTPRLLSCRFQFTHPGRGATRWTTKRRRLATCFNSRTPGGVRLLPFMRDELKAAVSIHAPREGCDQIVVTPNLNHSLFQFTHPGRGATSSKSAYFFRG